MIGSFKVSIKNPRNSYSFELKRNITILQGNSGSGKTTLFEMIKDYNRDGKQSGIKLNCGVPVIALDSFEWERKLSTIQNSIVVIDEDSKFITSKAFARMVKNSTNYFLLITRQYLSTLPYSVDEIYEISGNKNKRFKRIYKPVGLMYDRPNPRRLPFMPEVIVTEDSNSGYQFFSSLVSNNDCICISAKSKSNIYNKIKEYPNKKVLIIADGAAFGSEMHVIVERQKLNSHTLAICLPESFEWVILKSGVTGINESDEILYPEKFVDSAVYESWEQYFTHVLEENTKNPEYMKYRKSRLADYYFQERVMNQIASVFSEINFR